MASGIGMGYQCYISKAHMCEKRDIVSPSPSKRKIKLQKIHLTCSFGGRNYCNSKHVTFLESKKHHRHMD